MRDGNVLFSSDRCKTRIFVYICTKVFFLATVKVEIYDYALDFFFSVSLVYVSVSFGLSYCSEEVLYVGVFCL